MSDEHFGTRVREIRLARRMTQADLADRSGHAVSYICDLENGKRSPKLETAMDVADALRVPLVRLAYGPPPVPETAVEKAVGS